eukprot:8586159-Alexandrium_andersonii.AAC.1
MAPPKTGHLTRWDRAPRRAQRTSKALAVSSDQPMQREAGAVANSRERVSTLKYVRRPWPYQVTSLCK